MQHDFVFEKPDVTEQGTSTATNAEQADEKWWERYSIRAGAEATMSEMKRGHGMGKLRVRRMPRVRLAVCLKNTACNVKRWLSAAPVISAG